VSTVELSGPSKATARAQVTMLSRRIFETGRVVLEALAAEVLPRRSALASGAVEVVLGGTTDAAARAKMAIKE
jgi:hypothetical protein